VDTGFDPDFLSVDGARQSLVDGRHRIVPNGAGLGGCRIGVDVPDVEGLAGLELVGAHVDRGRAVLVAVEA